MGSVVPQRECELCQVQMKEDTVTTKAPGVESEAGSTQADQPMNTSFLEKFPE